MTTFTIDTSVLVVLAIFLVLLGVVLGAALLELVGRRRR